MKEEEKLQFKVNVYMGSPSHTPKHDLSHLLWFLVNACLLASKLNTNNELQLDILTEQTVHLRSSGNKNIEDKATLFPDSHVTCFRLQPLDQ